MLLRNTINIGILTSPSALTYKSNNPPGRNFAGAMPGVSTPTSLRAFHARRLCLNPLYRCSMEIHCSRSRVASVNRGCTPFTSCCPGTRKVKIITTSFRMADLRRCDTDERSSLGSASHVTSAGLSMRSCCCSRVSRRRESDSQSTIAKPAAVDQRPAVNTRGNRQTAGPKRPREDCYSG